MAGVFFLLALLFLVAALLKYARFSTSVATAGLRSDLGFSMFIFLVAALLLLLAAGVTSIF